MTVVESLLRRACGHDGDEIPCQTCAGVARYQRERSRLMRLRIERKAQLIEMHGGRCTVCGYDKSNRALQFHHRDPATKSFVLSGPRLQKAWATVVAEAEKCDLLCANCHAELEERVCAAV